MNIDTLRTSAFNALANKETKDLVKTKLCLYFKVGCPNKEKCSFAHSKEELKPSMCRFDKACRKRDCWFYHSTDKPPTQDELFEQATQGIKFIEEKPKEIIKKETKIGKKEEKTNKYHTPFIITEESDDEFEDMDENTAYVMKAMKAMEISEETTVEVSKVEVSKVEVSKVSLTPPPQRAMRVQFEVIMTTDQMMDVMSYIRSKGMAPTIVSLQ